MELNSFNRFDRKAYVYEGKKYSDEPMGKWRVVKGFLSPLQNLLFKPLESRESSIHEDQFFNWNSVHLIFFKWSLSSKEEEKRLFKNDRVIDGMVYYNFTEYPSEENDG